MKDIFNLKEAPRLYSSKGELTLCGSTHELVGISLSLHKPSSKNTLGEPACKVCYASDGNKTFAIVTENPVGENVLDETELQQLVSFYCHLLYSEECCGIK